MNERLLGVVLAGGPSSRMGRDKALLLDAGRTFAETAAAALAGLCEEILICANARNAPSLARLRAGRVLVDERPWLGPLMGVVAGLSQARGRSCVFVPCDAPELTVQEVFELVESWPGQAPAAAARLDGALVKPLPFLCRPELLEEARLRLGQGGQDSALCSLLALPGCALIDVAGERWRRALSSVDTRRQFEQLALRRAQTCLN